MRTAALLSAGPLLVTFEPLIPLPGQSLPWAFVLHVEASVPAGDYDLPRESLPDSFLGGPWGLALALFLRRSSRSYLSRISFWPSVSFSGMSVPPFILAIMPRGRAIFNTPWDLFAVAACLHR